MIIRNSAKCRKCGDEIESTHVHDYKHCKCGEISVDGGQDYLRRGAKDLSSIEDTSIIDENSHIVANRAASRVLFHPVENKFIGYNGPVYALTVQDRVIKKVKNTDPDYKPKYKEEVSWKDNISVWLTEYDIDRLHDLFEDHIQNRKKDTRSLGELIRDLRGKLSSECADD